MEVSIIHCDEESPRMPKIRKKKDNNEKTMEINCRLHCLEKKDLDSINKGCDTRQLNTSPELNLRLKPKKCCKNQTKPKLPAYNGCISEYGLTEKQKEKKKIKNEKRRKLKKERTIRIEEEKIARDLYNEQIFSDWLKAIAQRNKNARNISSSCTNRPKSAAEVQRKAKHNKNRPMTSKCQHYNTMIVLHPGVTLRTKVF